MLTTILVFVLILFALVLVHEWGHFIVAKKTGMRVDEFGIGFPPKLFGVKKGETEYTFNLLPIGGFVKIYGEDGADAPSSPVRSEAEDRRYERSEAGEGGEDLEPSIDKHDRDRSFIAQNKWKQAAVLVAGVTMNALFAWFLFALALGIGVPTAVSESEAGSAADLVVTEVVADSPAMSADIPQGAIITGIAAAGDRLTDPTPSQFSEFIRDRGGEEITITYERAETQYQTMLTPERGLLDSDDYAIGVALSLIEVRSQPIHLAITEGFVMTVTTLRDITVAISGLLWNAIQIDADLSQVAGPVGIVGLVGDASAFGLTALLMFTAFISLNLAIINLLPFPALDGGRLLFVVIEAIKGTPIRPQLAQTLNTIGFALLMLLIIVVTWNDIARLL